MQPGAHIRAFTRINGPCYVGRDVNVMGGDISGCSIGDVCKVRGELSNTIFVGHSNKGHDGFVGHSYLGRWVNLGAGTITSNLKNTYGTVALWTPTGVRDTGMQFLGTLFGDHVKTGIGLRLTTGTVLGAGANVYGRHAAEGRRAVLVGRRASVRAVSRRQVCRDGGAHDVAPSRRADRSRAPSPRRDSRRPLDRGQTGSSGR